MISSSAIPWTANRPASRTEVWVAYDDKALYVAARLHDAEPGKIVGLLGRRDDDLDSDWFTFAVDPYFDRRSGYSFSVNPAGSIIDCTLYNDEWNDDTWDGVWESAAQVDDRGWTVEMRIPYDQLRFPVSERIRLGGQFQAHHPAQERAGFISPGCPRRRAGSFRTSPA